jgi:prepilin-type N-terminal cleavage/methylation domain-containing protein
MNKNRNCRFQQGQSHYIRELRPSSKKLISNKNSRNGESGFTLVELLIVITILPLIVGALSAGLIAVFSLQSGVSSRLSHTADAQAVSANFERDIQGALQVTEQSTPGCGAMSGATQLLGLESNQDLNSASSDPNSGQYLTTISYLSVPVIGASSTTYSLIRASCTGPANALTLQSAETLAFDVSGTQAAPTIACVTGYTGTCGLAAANGWLNAQNVSSITFPVNDPSNNYPYTLVGSPVASTSTTNNGSPINSKATTACNLGTPNSGNLAPNLCFVNFSPVSGAAILAAEGGGCLEMSVSLPNNDTMFFCLSISGGTILPWYLPTYPEAFLGNSIGGVPFYTGVPGDPALYQRTEGTTSIITFSQISVVSSLGIPATGWEAVSTDAESTDAGESLTWTSDATLNVIANGESGQTQPMGNACLDDGHYLMSNGTIGNLPAGASGLTGNGTTSITCSGTITVNGTTYNITNGQKTGAAMVWAPAPKTLTVTLVGTGLEAITFGMLLP